MKPSATNPERTKKFEYKIVGVNGDVSDKGMTKKLNALGEQGWELCSLQTDGSHTLIFKREKKDRGSHVVTFTSLLPKKA